MSLSRAAELIEIFDHFDGKYKREEVEEALSLREEITPLLIQHLQELLDDPKAYKDNERYGNVYAASLLSHFKEPLAHDILIKTFNLDYDLIDALWGDLITEYLPAYLCQTCDGSVERIKELILDRDAYEYVRTSAIDALVFAVMRENVSREEVVAFLRSLLDDYSLADGDEYFWTNLVRNIIDFCPEELKERLLEFMEDDQVYLEYFPADVELAMASGKDVWLEALRERANGAVPEDIHSYMSWFACFREKRQQVRLADSVIVSDKQKKAKARIKRKQAKASKRKNRK